MSAAPPSTQQSFSSAGYVGVHAGHTIFVLIDDRAAFDAINLPMTDHGPNNNGGHVITKFLDDKASGIYIIFQHWLAKLPEPGA